MKLRAASKNAKQSICPKSVFFQYITEEHKVTFYQAVL